MSRKLANHNSGWQSHWRVVSIAGPLIISNITIPLLGLVDTAVIGHLDDAAYLGAVSVGAMIFSFIFWGFGFLKMSTTGFAAQAHGKSDRAALSRTVAQGIGLSQLIAIVLIVTHGWISDLALTMVDSTDAVESQAALYFSIRIWSSPATLLNFVMIGWFIGIQKTTVPLLILLIANLVNIILDIVFVVMLGMAVEGVALASVIGEYLAALTGLWFLHRHGVLRLAGSEWRDAVRLSGMAEVLRNQRDILIRTLLLILVFAFMTRQSATFGVTVLAANAVLMNFQHLMAYGLDGFAHAAEALVGQAIGKKDPGRLRRVIVLTGQWTIMIAIIVTGLYWLGAGWIISLLTDIEPVRQVASDMLPWIIAAPVISCWCFWLDGVYIGATAGTTMRNSMLVSVLCFFLPAWYLTVEWGYDGLWFAFLVFMAARAITLAVRLPVVMDAAR